MKKNCFRLFNRTTFVILIATALFVGSLSYYFFLHPSEANADVTVTLIEPADNSFLSGTIQATAQVDSAAQRVEFNFLELTGKFSFVYDGNAIGGNQWQYNWSTNESIDGTYRVYAVAVDSNNFTYLSGFNTIIVNNGGGSPPEPDLNINGNPYTNTNQNENLNANYNQNGNLNQNENLNQNVNLNENTNLNTPFNSNQNENINSNPDINQNLNQPLTNTPVINAPPKQDDDNDELPNNDELQNGTDPQNPDSDDDELLDGFEIEHGFNPLQNDNATPIRTPNNTIIDEINQALNSNNPEDSLDSDQDGLPDKIELRLGSDPYDPDTSNDGLTDGFKAKYGYLLTADNSGYIVKKKIDLPNSQVQEVERTSYLTAGIILGILILIVIVVLFIFHPKQL